MKDYDHDYAQYSKALERFNDNKGKTIVVILGQCSDTLTKRLKASDKYATLYDEDDVVGLLDLIKELIDTNRDNECMCQTHVRHVMGYVHILQNNDENPLWETRIESAFDTLTNNWGDFVPTKLPKGETKESFTEKLKAYICLRGADRSRYKDIIDEVYKNHITGAGTFPPDSKQGNCSTQWSGRQVRLQTQAET